MASLMMWLAAMSGTAPSSVLATSMRTRRSCTATSRIRPSPTSLRPIFQVLPTRLAKAAMSSGAVVGTTSTTTCAPLSCSSAASLASSVAFWASSSVPEVSTTRAVSGGTGTSCWAWAARAENAINKIAISARRTGVRGTFYM